MAQKLPTFKELFEATKKKIAIEMVKASKFAKQFDKEVKFNNFTLTDGTKITTPADDIAEGVEVYKIDDQGNQTALDDGDYVLDDGRTFTVASGTVTVIALPAETQDDKKAESPNDAPVEQKKEKMDDAQPEAKPDKKGESESETGDDLESRVENIESTLADIIKILNSLQQGASDQNTSNEQMMIKLQALADEPGTESIQKGKRPAEEFSKENISSNKRKEMLDNLKQKLKTPVLYKN